LDTKKLFDGAKVLSSGNGNEIPQPGDVLLNMNFLNPYNAGTFYSKRGMIHARLVVNAVSTRSGVQLEILDGGWKKFSKLSQIHSQTIWLRPKADFFKADDVANLQKWAKLFEPVQYDNRLIDNLVEYRAMLNEVTEKLLAQDENGDGKPDLTQRQVQEIARKAAMDESSDEGFYPFGNPDTEQPKSGFYCSEAGSDIFSYLGFKLYGEVPFEVATAFSSDGKLPQWKVYEEALSGFGAGEGPVYMMHKQFFAYFSVLDAAWRKSILPLPQGYRGGKDNFAAIAWQNRENSLKLAAINPSMDPMLEQLDSLIEASAAHGDLQLNRQALESKRELLNLVAQMQQVDNMPNLNLTGAVDLMFFRTKAYGPNHFLENGDYFELKGVFYNTDLEGGYQAKWIADAGDVNASTTLYRINPSAPVANDGGCVLTETKLPALPTAL
jgi:hypothetical protein